VRNGRFRAGHIIIHHDHIVAEQHEPIDEMRAHKAGAACAGSGRAADSFDAPVTRIRLRSSAPSKRTGGYEVAGVKASGRLTPSQPSASAQID